MALVAMFFCNTILAQGFIINKTDGTSIRYENINVVSVDTYEEKTEPEDVYGYYRIDTSWEKQYSSEGWVPITVLPLILKNEGYNNYALASVNNIEPEFHMAMKSTYASANGYYHGSEFGFNNTITINGKEYYLWITEDNTASTTNKVKIIMK